LILPEKRIFGVYYVTTGNPDGRLWGICDLHHPSLKSSLSTWMQRKPKNILKEQNETLCESADLRCVEDRIDIIGARP
jgi:hypothetical protein